MMIGDKLRQLRKVSGFTLAEVGERVGLSVSFLSDMERGKTNPSLDSLKVLATCYGVYASEIIEVDETNAPLRQQLAEQTARADEWRHNAELAGRKLTEQQRLIVELERSNAEMLAALKTVLRDIDGREQIALPGSDVRLWLRRRDFEAIRSLVERAEGGNDAT